MSYPQQQPYDQGWQAPQYPQQPYQPQGYPPQAAPPYSAYGPQHGQPPVEPVRQGSLDEFYQQPSGAGGPSLKFNQKPNGHTYSGIVARKVTNADIRQQTDTNGRPVTFKDGRPKWIMIVPLRVQPSPEFPDGTASWWVKGQARDELVRAMAEAGAPEGPPEEGAAISITKTGERQIPNMMPQILYAVRYARPQGAAPVEQSAPAPQPEQPQQAPQQPHSTQVWNAAAPQQPNTGQAPAQPTQAPEQARDGMTPEQHALLKQLTGQ